MAKTTKNPGPNRERYRSIESFKRPQNTRRERECILIVCEGKQTEPNYFKSLKDQLKLTIVRIEIISSGHTTPAQIVDFAIEKRDERKEAARRANTKSW
jgi:hypothetical protein